jgi:hypothetical protein
LEQESEKEESVDEAEREEEELQNVGNPEANSEIAVTVQGAKFSWSAECGIPTLNISNIVFPSGMGKL